MPWPSSFMDTDQTETSSRSIVVNSPTSILLSQFGSPSDVDSESFSVTTNNQPDFRVKATVTRTAAQIYRQSESDIRGDLVDLTADSRRHDYATRFAPPHNASMGKPFSGSTKPVNSLSRSSTSGFNSPYFQSTRKHPHSTDDDVAPSPKRLRVDLTDGLNQTAYRGRTNSIATSDVQILSTQPSMKKSQTGAQTLFNSLARNVDLSGDLSLQGPVLSTKRKRRRQSGSHTNSQSMRSVSPGYTSPGTRPQHLDEPALVVSPAVSPERLSKWRRASATYDTCQPIDKKEIGSVVSRMQPAFAAYAHRDSDELLEDELQGSNGDIPPTKCSLNAKTVTTIRKGRALTGKKAEWHIIQYIDNDFVFEDAQSSGQPNFYESDGVISFSDTGADHESSKHHFKLRNVRCAEYCVLDTRLRLGLRGIRPTEPTTVHIQFETKDGLLRFLHLFPGDVTIRPLNATPEEMVKMTKIFGKAKENASVTITKHTKPRPEDVELLEHNAKRRQKDTLNEASREEPSRKLATSMRRADPDRTAIEQEPAEFYRPMDTITTMMRTTRSRSQIEPKLQPLTSTPVTRSKRPARSPPPPSPPRSMWSQKNPDYRKNWTGGSLQWPLEEKAKSKVIVDVDDIPRLDDGEFLNDNLVQFWIRYLEYWLEKDEPVLRDRIHFMSSFFYAKLTQDGKGGIDYDKVKRWTRTVNVFEKDYIIVPVCAALHWYVMIICNPGKLLSSAMNTMEQVRSPGVNSGSSTRITLDNASSSPEASQTNAEVKQQLLDNIQSAENKAGQDMSDNISRIGNLSLEKHEDFCLNPKRWVSISDKPSSGKSSVQDSDPESDQNIAVSKAEQNAKSKEFVIITLDSLDVKHSVANKNLQSWLRGEAKDKRQIDIDSSTSFKAGVNAKNLPTQPNMSDCGVYLLGYLEQFLDNPEGFVQKTQKKDKNQRLYTFDAGAARQCIREVIMKIREDQKNMPIPNKRPSTASTSTVLESVVMKETKRRRLTEHMQGWPLIDVEGVQKKHKSSSSQAPSKSRVKVPAALKQELSVVEVPESPANEIIRPIIIKDDENIGDGIEERITTAIPPTLLSRTSQHDEVDDGILSSPDSLRSSTAAHGSRRDNPAVVDLDTDNSIVSSQTTVDISPSHNDGLPKRAKKTRTYKSSTPSRNISIVAHPAPTVPEPVVDFMDHLSRSGDLKAPLEARNTYTSNQEDEILPVTGSNFEVMKHTFQSKPSPTPVHVIRDPRAFQQQRIEHKHAEVQDYQRRPVKAEERMKLQDKVKKSRSSVI